MVIKLFEDETCTFTIYYKIPKNPQQIATKFSTLQAAGAQSPNASIK